MGKPNPMGATFAERTAAARGDKDFADPTPAAPEAAENTSFAQRAKAAVKAVKGDDDKVEDKAVKKAAASKKS